MSAWMNHLGSLATSTARALPGRQAASRPNLRLVPQPLARMSRVPFLLVLATILGVGMVGLLLLNTTLQTRAFEVRNLQRQATMLGYSQSELEGEVAAARSPEVLARRATELGMAPNPYPAFISMTDGKVTGKPHKVTGEEMTSMTVGGAKEKAAAKTSQAKTKQSVGFAVQKQAAAIAKEQAAAKKAAEDAKKAEAAKKKAAADKKKQNTSQQNNQQNNSQQNNSRQGNGTGGN